VNKIDLKTVALGSDAEVFLVDRTGRPFPACGIIGGTKAEPLMLTKDGVAVQEDNVMLEFNTPISYDGSTWVKNLQRSMNMAFARIPPSLRPEIVGSMNFDPAFLEIPQAQTFGCEPDYNAWTMTRNPRPKPSEPTLRTAAAHVHISWAEPEGIEQRCRVIQMADIFVTLPGLDWSLDRKRRSMYGRAGAFRGKDYGVEHRVQDNAWLLNTDRLIYTWQRYQQALKAVNTDYEIKKEDAIAVQDAINNYDVSSAMRLYDRLRKEIFPQKPKEMKGAKPIPQIEVHYDISFDDLASDGELAQ
jgi:hypothetical protein